VLPSMKKGRIVGKKHFIDVKNKFLFEALNVHHESSKDYNNDLVMFYYISRTHKN
jgi:hypothetical protein